MILTILMNLYILSHSTDEYDTKEYGNFEKCFIGCKLAYTYGDYVYFSKNIGAPKEHNNQFILNQ